MPAFVIHGIGQQPRKVVVDASPVRVGRDPTNDIVLQGTNVSREHAQFMMDDKGKWHVACVSDTNPIVVDSALITAGAQASEGTEIVIGSDHMIIFSENNFTANAYMGGKRYFEKSECVRCHWSGMVSSIRSKPVCPKCGSIQLAPMEAQGPDGVVAAGGGHRLHKARFTAATAAMTSEQVKQVWGKLKEAKHSQLERIDGRDKDQPKSVLEEDKAVELGKGTTATMLLAGFCFGRVHVAWDGAHYIATSSMTFPAMKVNGIKAKSAQLAHGDVIEVGPNRFKFVTGKATS